MTKGFKFRLRSEDHTCLITNEGIESGVSFIFASGMGNKYDLTDLEVIAEMNIDDDNFLELVKRLNLEADKIKNKQKKESPKTTVDFGDEKPKTKGKKKNDTDNV